MLKAKIIDFSVKYIKKNKICSKKEEEIIRYGLGNLYLQITKTIFITLLAILFKLFIPYITFIITFNFIRCFSFGMHAQKSWQCWITSSIIFILTPFLIKNINISLYIKQIISIICIIFIFKNSPADTVKRPIISSKRRLIYKYLSTAIAIIYSFLSIYIDNNIISNSLLFSLILQMIIISPITYKLFGLPYNNYLKYRKENLNVC